MKNLLLLCIILCFTRPGFSQPPKNKYTLLITNANIVDVAHNKILSHKLIAISGNTILAVADTKLAAQYKADRYINAAGKYIMPGLWDMHIHLRGGADMVQANKNLLPLFLANGITTVRECGGDLTPQIMQWRQQIAKGILDGPRIFTSGPKLDGPKPTWAGSLLVETPQQVSKALDSLHQLHTDFVKIYESKISRDAYLQAVSQAHKRGLKTTGHMPYTVKLTEAVDLGMNGSEHLYYIFKACSSKEDSITTLVQQREHTDKPLGLFGALPALYDTYDDAKAQQLFKYLALHNFTVTPTLYVSKTLDEIKTTDHTTDTLLAYIDPKIQATYLGRVASAKKQTEAGTQFTLKYAGKAAAMVPQMYKAGVNIVAGSDCGAFNSFVYPGQSLHGELKLLVKAGLTPAQALSASVINGAKFFGISNFYGAIEAGKCSDMVMINTDPLQNIDAVDDIQTVITSNKIYTLPQLQALMRSIKR